MKHFLKVFVFALILVVMLASCATPRQGSIIPLRFSEQASTALMRVDCNGQKQQVRGVFVCEEKEPHKTILELKILPTPGRVIYSNGLTKKIEDFNWGKAGFWFWKKSKITDTWVSLDLGELNTVFGDTPIAFDIAGTSDKGVIVNRGIFYHRRCNDRDIPCSYLMVKYECLGEVKNTYNNQLGYCNRMSGSPQNFEIPLRTTDMVAKAGSKLIMVSGRTGQSQVIKITQEDYDKGFVRVSYPNVVDGPDLIGFRLNYLEQGVQVFKQTYVLLVGYDPAWTGIDKPHFLIDKVQDNNFNGEGTPNYSSRENIEFSLPVLADLMEVVDDKGKRKVAYGGQIEVDMPKQKVCAYAWHRVSGDVQKVCLDSKGKEVE